MMPKWKGAQGTGDVAYMRNVIAYARGHFAAASSFPR